MTAADVMAEMTSPDGFPSPSTPDYHRMIARSWRKAAAHWQASILPKSERDDGAARCERHAAAQEAEAARLEALTPAQRDAEYAYRTT